MKKLLLENKYVKNSILYIFILTLYSFSNAPAKPKIIVSISPIASLVASLVEDEAEVESLIINNSCPHLYQTKPSDIKKIQNADILIYVSPKFDYFAHKLMHNQMNDKIVVADLKNLNIRNNNWHFWLDLENAKIFLKEIAVILSEKFPDIKDNIYSNLVKSIKKLEKLDLLKKEKLLSIADFIVLSDSLEYLLEPNIYKLTKLYNRSQKSLKYLDIFKEHLDESTSKCVIINNNENSDIYKKFTLNLVAIDSENWQIEKISSDLFFVKYKEIINNISNICIPKTLNMDN